MSDQTTLDRVRALVLPVVADLHLDLYDLEFRGGTLRVTVDTPPGSPGGVDLDQLALITRLVSRDLDHYDPVPGHYTLEVTSPGLERSLRTAAHFQREVGKTVNVRLRDTAGADRRFQGVLVAADEQAFTVLLDTPAADGSTERTVPYTLLDRARTVFVWGPAPKPGGPKAKGAKAGKGAVRAAGGHDTLHDTLHDTDTDLDDTDLDDNDLDDNDLDDDNDHGGDSR